MNLPTASGVTRLRNLLWISSALLVAPLAVGSCAKDHPHEESFTVEGRYEALTVTPSTTFESLHFTKSGRYHGTLANCAAVVCDELGSYELDASHGALRLTADGGAKRSFAIQRSRAGAEAPSTSTQSLHAATLHPRTSSAEVASTDDDPCSPGDGEDGDADSSAADVTSLLSGSGSSAILADCSALQAAGIAEGFELSNDPATKSPDGLVGADLVTLLRKGPRDSNRCSAALNQPGTCAGAVGVNCCLSSSAENKALGFAPVPNVGCSVTNEANVVECFVSVGSLMHDTCCEEHPGGQSCGGGPTELCPVPANSGYPTAVYPCCTGEWDHAVHDSAVGRVWKKRFTIGIPQPSWNGAHGGGVDGEFAATSVGPGIWDTDPARSDGEDLHAPAGTPFFWKDTDKVCASGTTDSRLFGYKVCR